jgi:hypothetical protein
MSLKSHAQIQSTLSSQYSDRLSFIDKVRSFFHRQDSSHRYDGGPCGQHCQYTNGVFIASRRKHCNVYLFSFPYGIYYLRTEYIKYPFPKTKDIGEEFQVRSFDVGSYIAYSNLRRFPMCQSQQPRKQRLQLSISRLPQTPKGITHHTRKYIPAIMLWYELSSIPSLFLSADGHVVFQPPAATTTAFPELICPWRTV